MAIEGLTGDLLRGLAASGEPYRREIDGYLIEVYVRKMEAFELEEIHREREAELAEATVHPLAIPSRHDRRVPTR